MFQEEERGGGVGWMDDSSRQAGDIKDVEALFFAEIETVAEKIGKLEFAGRRLFLTAKLGGKGSILRQQWELQCLAFQLSGITHLTAEPLIRSALAGVDRRHPGEHQHFSC